MLYFPKMVFNISFTFNDFPYHNGIFKVEIAVAVAVAPFFHFY